MFGAVLIGGVSITLPNAKVSFAAYAPSASHSSIVLERPYITALVGMRRATYALSGGARTFGGLERVAFLGDSHSGELTYGAETITLPFDRDAGTYSFGPMRLKRELVKTMVDASFLAGVDPRLLMAIADKESSFIVRARASTSSATGLFQFIETTWLRAIRDHGPRFGLAQEAALVEIGEAGANIPDERERERILNMRNDPLLSTLMAASMLRMEQEKLAERLGRSITDADVYLVHFLGPAGAQKFLSVLAEKPKTPAARLLPKAAKANRPIFFATRKRKTQSLSVAQVHEKIGSSLERRLVRYRDLDFGRATAFAPVQAGGRLRPDPFAGWRL